MLKKPIILALIIIGIDILFFLLSIPIKALIGKNTFISLLLNFSSYLVPAFFAGYIYTENYNEEFTKELKSKVAWYSTIIEMIIGFIFALAYAYFLGLKLWIITISFTLIVLILSGLVQWWCTYFILGISSKYTLQRINGFKSPEIDTKPDKKKKAISWLIVVLLIPIIFTQIASSLKQIGFWTEHPMFGLIGTILLPIFLLIMIFFAYKNISS